MTTGHEPRVVRVSLWCYRRLLGLFPRSFRLDYGRALIDAFGDAVRDRYAATGWRGVVALWTAALVDLVREAPAERWATLVGRDRPLSGSRPTVPHPHTRRSPMSAFWQDFRFAVRALSRSPGYALTVVGTMALGIGAVITMFAVLDGVLLTPLPFDGSDRVFQVCETSPKVGSACVASPSNLADLARGNESVEAAGVARFEPFGLDTPDGRVPLRSAIASPGFFRAIALRPELGRALEPTDLPTGANDVAIVSRAFFETHLGGRADRVGQTIRVDGRDLRVIGVLPADAYVPFFDGVDLWRPLTASVDDTTKREWRGFTGLVRARSGVTRQALAAVLTSRYEQLRTTFPEANQGWALALDSVLDRTVAPARATIWLFQAAALLLLGIACANVAGLVLVRGIARDAEFAIRGALGAGRGRLARQLMVEGVVISLAAAAVGLPVAALATHTLVGLAPANLPRLTEVGVDARVVLVAVGLAMMTAVIFGLVPLRGRAQARASSALRAQRHGGTAGRLQTTFVVVQLALAFALLTSAGLVIRAFTNLSAWDPGFDRAGIVTTWLLAPPDRVGTIEAAVDALARGRAAVEHVPGVLSAGLGSTGPLLHGEESGELVRPDRPDAGAVPVLWFDADAGYFSTLGLGPIRGRLFTDADTAASPTVAVINTTLARQAFGTDDPIGKRVAVGNYASEVVGVVADLPMEPGSTVRPAVYWPIAQYRRLAAFLFVRTAPGVSVPEATIRRALAEAAPAVETSTFRSMDVLFARALAGPRFNTWLAGVFATVAIALAAVGIYGVMAFAVATRRREIGVRIALGATPRGMTRHFVRRTLGLVTLGALAGLVLSVLAARGLSALLFGLPASDPLALASAIGVFGVVATFAGYVPARRASRVDPIDALRTE